MVGPEIAKKSWVPGKFSVVENVTPRNSGQAVSTAILAPTTVERRVNVSVGVQPRAPVAATYQIWKVIGASSVGTMIEWYDFYIFGSLATALSPSSTRAATNSTLALIAYLSTFAVGFVVRPFGALFFGRIGDLVGRKYAFPVTLADDGRRDGNMGSFRPTRPSAWLAPIALLVIRIIQGLALQGIMAERPSTLPSTSRMRAAASTPVSSRLRPPWGRLLSALILFVQSAMSVEAFRAWGWRVPFLISIVLVAVSLYVRLRMKESPIFQHLKSAGMTSAQPLKDAFTNWPSLRRVLISLFGATAGQGVGRTPASSTHCSTCRRSSRRTARQPTTSSRPLCFWVCLYSWSSVRCPIALAARES